MKLLGILTLIFALFTATGCSVRLRNPFRGIFDSTYRIPQFIRDAHHPWLEQNKHFISQLENPKEALCSLDSPMRMHDDNTLPSYPADFFKYLEIDNNRYDVNRPGWGNALQRLTEMFECPAALHDVEYFKVAIWASDEVYNIISPERVIPPARLPNLFMDVLKSMPNLTQLEWTTFGKGNKEFEQAFSKANLTLSSVHHLNFDILSSFWIALCPEVQQVHSGSRMSSPQGWALDEVARLACINSTASAKSLTDFGLDGEWSLYYLEALHLASPNISKLAIGGSIHHPYNSKYLASHGLTDEGPDRTLEDFANSLTRFPHLKTLELPDSSELHLGWDGGPWCGNAYDGPGGDALHRWVYHELAKATDLATSIVLKMLPNLEDLSIGGYGANITRDQRGEVNATYPWTGRIEAWTYEMWPHEYHDEL